MKEILLIYTRLHMEGKLHSNSEREPKWRENQTVGIQALMWISSTTASQQNPNYDPQHEREGSDRIVDCSYDT